MLSDSEVIRKSGIHWAVGPPISSRTNPVSAPIIGVVQETPDSIWFRFADQFITEAENSGVAHRHVLFNSGHADDGIAAGMREFHEVVKQCGDRYAGTLIVSPRARGKTAGTVEWIRYAASRRTTPVYHLCTSLDWVEIEKRTGDLPNVYLALFGDWQDHSIEISMTGLVVEVLQKLAHRTALFIDTFGKSEDLPWIESRLMNLRKGADIRGTLNISECLVGPGSKELRGDAAEILSTQLKSINRPSLSPPTTIAPEGTFMFFGLFELESPGIFLLFHSIMLPLFVPTQSPAWISGCTLSATKHSTVLWAIFASRSH